MVDYKNVNGNSGILRYEIGSDFIIVEFQPTGAYKKYKYSYSTPGRVEVERMKLLAIQGYGLNSFINLQIKGRYESRS